MRVAIAGCGLIAGGPVREGRPIRGTHAEACKAVPGVELVAAADPDEARRSAFSRYWSLDAVYDDVDTMLDASRPDLLIVATPPETHEAMCRSGVNHGVRGILCEKPFTGNASAASRVAAVCKSAGTALAVNFIRRWDASHRALAERLRNGAIGELRVAFGTYTGTLRGNGSHLVDTLSMMAGDSWQVEWASRLSDDDRDGPIDAVLRHEHFDSRAFIAPVRDAEFFVFELHLLGTRGRARLLRQGNELWIDAPAPHPDYPGYRYLSAVEQFPADTLPSAFPRALAALVDAIRTKTPIDPPPETSVRTLSLLDDIVTRATESA